MNWIDIRVRKPTDADADDDGNVLALYARGCVCDQPAAFLNSDIPSLCVAWLDPKLLPKFTPIPNPPEGYRWIDQERDKPKRQDDLYWCETNKLWKECGVGFNWFCPEDAYARRIDPPKPQYRPFANAAEFEPFADRWVRCKPEKCETYRIYAYNNQLFWMGTAVEGVSFEEGLRDYCFSDGTPFGIKVE